MPKKSLKSKSIGKSRSSIIIDNSNPKQFPWKWVVVVVIIFLLSLGGVMIYNTSQSTTINPSNTNPSNTNPSNTESSINLTVSKNLLQSLINKESSVPVLNAVKRSNSMNGINDMNGNREWMIGRVVGTPPATNTGQFSLTGSATSPTNSTGFDISTGVGRGLSTAKKVYKKEGKRRKRFNESTLNEVKNHTNTFIQKSKLPNNLKIKLTSKLSQVPLNTSFDANLQFLKEVRAMDLFLEFQEKILPLTGLSLQDCAVSLVQRLGETAKERFETHVAFCLQNILCVISKELNKPSPNVDILTACFILLISFTSIDFNTPMTDIFEINGEQFLIKGDYRDSLFETSNTLKNIYGFDVSILEDSLSENMFGKVCATLSRIIMQDYNNFVNPNDCILCKGIFEELSDDLVFGTGNYIISGSSGGTGVRTGI